MNIPDLLKLYDQELREQIEYPEARKEITADVVRFVRDAPAMNFVALTYASDNDLDRVIDQQLAYFAPRPQPFSWKVYQHDLERLPSFKRKLAAHHFLEDEPGDVMLLDIEEAPAHLSGPTAIDIRRVTDLAGLQDIIFVLNTVYGNDNSWVNARLGGHLKVPGYLSIYAVYIDDRPASIGWTYFPKGHFATLFAGTTLAEYRQRGLYTSLLAARLKEIRERGYRYAVVETGDMSKPIVAKHGFQYLTTVWDYVWQRRELDSGVVR